MKAITRSLLDPALLFAPACGDDSTATPDAAGGTDAATPAPIPAARPGRGSHSPTWRGRHRQRRR
jgi:hypothetical protein